MDRMVIIKTMYNLHVGVLGGIGIDQDRSLGVLLAAQISGTLLQPPEQAGHSTVLGGKSSLGSWKNELSLP